VHAELVHGLCGRDRVLDRGTSNETAGKPLANCGTLGKITDRAIFGQLNKEGSQHARVTLVVAFGFQELLHFKRRHTTGTGGGDGLAVAAIHDVAGGKHAGHAGVDELVSH